MPVICGATEEKPGPTLAPSSLPVLAILPPECFSLCAPPHSTHGPFRPLNPLPDERRTHIRFHPSALQPESVFSNT